jgi:hypothetical protein
MTAICVNFHNIQYLDMVIDVINDLVKKGAVQQIILYQIHDIISEEHPINLYSLNLIPECQKLLDISEIPIHVVYEETPPTPEEIKAGRRPESEQDMDRDTVELLVRTKTDLIDRVIGNVYKTIVFDHDDGIFSGRYNGNTGNTLMLPDHRPDTWIYLATNHLVGGISKPIIQTNIISMVNKFHHRPLLKDKSYPLTTKKVDYD